ncbi:MAG: insulinase family protein [bacterium]|nr:insulinase family protein [bacterium]
MWHVKLLTLKNGIDVYYGEQYRCNTGGIGVRVGGMHAPPGKIGLPHFVEHKITRSSKKYPDGKEVSLLLHRYLGKDVNIRTDRSSTYYGHDDLLRKDYRLKMFDLMASFYHPDTRIIDLQGLKVEKGAVHNEYRQNGTDSIDALLDDGIYQALYT